MTHLQKREEKRKRREEKRKEGRRIMMIGMIEDAVMMKIGGQ